MRRKKTAANNLEQPEVVDGGFVIDALTLPYGGHKMGKDCAGEFFDSRTDFKTAALRYPPVVYAHGMPIDKGGEADRTVVGETLERWYDNQGGWAKLKIYDGTPFTEEIRNAYVKRTLKFSSYGLLKRVAKDGHIETWLPGEFTVATHETGVSVCNLLSKAQPYGKLAFEEIYNGQDATAREQLRKLLEEDGESTEPLDPADLTATNNTNPAGADADADALKEFATEEEDDMKPEELKSALDGALAPLLSRVEALEKPATPAEPDKKQKTETPAGGDLMAFVKQKTETLQVDGATNLAATQLVDGYINAGRITPEKRLQMIATVSGAIIQDGRSKIDGGALDAVVEMIEAGAVIASKSGDKLKMFGYKAADPKSSDDKDVESMGKAALAD